MNRELVVIRAAQFVIPVLVGITRIEITPPAFVAANADVFGATRQCGIAAGECVVFGARERWGAKQPDQCRRVLHEPADAEEYDENDEVRQQRDHHGREN